MDFIDFAKSHGFILESVYPSEKIKRCPTQSKPRSTNGAYYWDGKFGWIRDWSMDGEVIIYKSNVIIDRNELIVSREAERRKRDNSYEIASKMATEIVNSSKLKTHYYLNSKGFPDFKWLVYDDDTPQDVLIVPMRDFYTNKLLGVQKIKWDGERHSKKMLYGMRAKEAVFFLGDRSNPEYFLCEGFATGLSIKKATDQMRSKSCVVICFSASNLSSIGAKIMDKHVYIYADNDASKTGEESAKKTGHPYIMSDKIGNDANDDMLDFGIHYLENKIVKLRRSK